MTTTTASRQLSLPSARVLFATMYVLCVVSVMAFSTGQIVFTDVDPHQNDGPIESILTVAAVGTLALVLAVGIGLAFRGSPKKDAMGAVTLAVLAVPAVVVFWAGVPGIFGAAAAWKAGLTRGGTPLDGAGRVAGLIGVFLAITNVALTIVGLAVG